MPTTAPRLPAPPPTAGLYEEQVRRYWASWIDWAVVHWLQIAVASAIGAVIVAALMGMRWLALTICRRDRGATHWGTIFARALVRTSVWFMIAVAAKVVEGYADTPATVAQTIHFFFTVAATLQAAIWARELILGFVEHRAGVGDEHASLASALGLIRVLVTITLFAIALLMILDNLGVNVTGLVAGLGIGGIAIGLAAKGIFDDLFSALSIIFDRPFRRGDTIKWDQTTGTVEAIGLKTTRIRATTGEEVVVSNTNILNKELHNLARLDKRRVIFPVGVTYDTPPEVCADIPARIERIVTGVPNCTVNTCGMVGFGDSSLDFEVQIDVHTKVWKEVFEARAAILIGILKDFNEAGIDFAFPTQTTIYTGPDGKPLPPTAAGGDQDVGDPKDAESR